MIPARFVQSYLKCRLELFASFLKTAFTSFAEGESVFMKRGETIS
jgi:hypothetical protein